MEVQIKKSALKQSNEKRLLLYREKQVQKFFIKFKDEEIDNSIQPSRSLLSLRENYFDSSLAPNEFNNSYSARSLPEFSDESSNQNDFHVKARKHEYNGGFSDSRSYNNLRNNKNFDDDLTISGTNFHSEKLKNTKKKNKKSRKKIEKLKFDSEHLPMIREATEINEAFPASPRSIHNCADITPRINENKQLYTLPKLNITDYSYSHNKNLLNTYYTSSFPLISTSLPIINLNKLSTVDNYEKKNHNFNNYFISNMRNKMDDNTTHIIMNKDFSKPKQDKYVKYISKGDKQIMMSENSSSNSFFTTNKLKRMNINFSMNSKIL